MSSKTEATTETIPRAAIDQAIAGDTSAIMFSVYDAARRHTSLPTIMDPLTVEITHQIKKSAPPSGWIRVQVTREGDTVSHRAEIVFDKHGDGHVRRIWELRPADLAAVRGGDATLPLDPMEFYDDAVLLMDGEKLVVRNLDREQTPEWGTPRYIPMPEYTRGDQEAMVFLRADGTVQCGLAVLESGYLWLARSYKFDEPVIAMRRIQTESGPDVEIYRQGDDVEARQIYKNGAALPRDTGAAAHSAWVPMRVYEDFQRIRDLLPIALADSGFCLETRLNRLNAEFHAAYAAKDFASALTCGTQYLDTPHCHQGQRTPCGTYMGDTVMRYQLACVLTKLGRDDEAMHLLLKNEPKWQHWSTINGDSDFDKMRERVDFQELMARHA